MTVVAVSGGFDPLHIGHLELIEGARRYGYVVVVLNSDDWLIRKKGYAFMPFEQRKRILEALEDVEAVINVDDSDGTVCEGLRHCQPDFFANGGDRTRKNTPELELCGYLGIEPLFGVGGLKAESSSDMVRRVLPLVS